MALMLYTQQFRVQNRSDQVLPVKIKRDYSLPGLWNSERRIDRSVPMLWRKVRRISDHVDFT